MHVGGQRSLEERGITNLPTSADRICTRHYARAIRMINGITACNRVTGVYCAWLLECHHVRSHLDRLVEVLPPRPMLSRRSLEPRRPPPPQRNDFSRGRVLLPFHSPITVITESRNVERKRGARSRDTGNGNPLIQMEARGVIVR